MTEDEAKWCPFVRVTADEVDGTINRWSLDNDNRSNPFGDHNACIGSACMAWRWYRTHINNPDNPKGDLIESTHTHGFCGLAGHWHQGERP